MTLQIDPLLSLAITLHANRGCYAVLLGSGVSRAAGIGSAWDIICDLVRRVAQLSGQNSEPDPIAWFTKEFRVEPTYGELLNQLAGSPAERRNLLQSYFEPTAEERDDGKKQPTTAHKAIATLVQKGFIRVVLTTNFDRLMEQALEAAGVHAQVVASADAVLGALPLPHAPCLLVKLHGDYLDTRIKNAPHELEAYDPAFNQLLDRVLDEYGLIVCGWSADWDPALRAAIERCKTHRFSTYWISRGDPSPVASSLIALRKAAVIRTAGADEFFATLAEHVQSIEDTFCRAPVTKAIAIASLKRYLAEDRHRIKLHDLIRDYTEKAFAALTDEEFLKVRTDRTFSAVAPRIQQFEDRLGDLLALMITGCFWATPQNHDVWRNCFERIAAITDYTPPFLGHPDFRAVPASLLLYGGGMAAMAAGNYALLKRLLDVTLSVKGTEFTAARWLRADYAFEQDKVELSPPNQRSLSPASDYMYARLWNDFRDVQPDEQKYARLFDRFECLLSLAALDVSTRSGSLLDGAYVGRFGWTWRRDPMLNALEQLKAEQQNSGASWPPLKSGFFGGDCQRFQTLLGTLAARMHDKLRSNP